MHKHIGGLDNAIDLVRLIRAEHGDHFCIAVGGFPEGHPTTMANLSPRKLSHDEVLVTSSTTSTVSLSDTAADGSSIISNSSNHNTDPDMNNNTSSSSMIASRMQQDFIYLREKVEAGADFILTNFFYDAAVFLEYVTQCRLHGITCPIIPGMMKLELM